MSTLTPDYTPLDEFVGCKFSCSYCLSAKNYLKRNSINSYYESIFQRNPENKIIPRFNGTIIEASLTQKQRNQNKLRNLPSGTTFGPYAGDWTDYPTKTEEIHRIFQLALIYKQHTFLWLTRSPDKLLKIIQENPICHFIPNIKFAVSVTRNSDLWRIYLLQQIATVHKRCVEVRFSPLLEPIKNIDLSSISNIKVSLERKGSNYPKELRESEKEEILLSITKQANYQGINWKISDPFYNHRISSILTVQKKEKAHAAKSSAL